MLIVTVTSRTAAATPINQFEAYRPSSSTAIAAPRFPNADVRSGRNGFPAAALRAAALASLSTSNAKGAATNIARAVTASQEAFSSTSASNSVKPALPHALCCAADVRYRKLPTSSAATPPSRSRPDARSGSGAQRGVRRAAPASSPVKVASAGLCALPDEGLWLSGRMIGSNGNANREHFYRRAAHVNCHHVHVQIK